MRHLLRKDKGNALIFGALTFAVLAVFGVLTIDIGRILLTRNQLQNGADSAALAGASVYCETGHPVTDEDQAEADAKARAQLVGQQNNALGLGGDEPIKIPDGDIDVQKDDTGGHTVTVQTHSTTAQYFLRLLEGAVLKSGNAGATSDAVHAVAAARCGPTFGVQCIKPWSPPDRWNDHSNLPGHADWNDNGQYDQEKFTDTNGNGVWDQGEPFTDTNGNGTHDEEYYSPTLTGYIPDPIPGNSLAPAGDLGTVLTLEFDNGNSPVPGNYQPVDLPPINRGTIDQPNPITGGDQFRENIATCNQSEVWPGDWLQTEPGAKVGPTAQGMRDLIAEDPNAYWDPITQSVQGSAFSLSPRIVLIPMYDPRTYPTPGRTSVRVVKIAAFFMEQMVNNSEVRARFLKVRAPGQPGGSGVSFTYNLSLIR